VWSAPDALGGERMKTVALRDAVAPGLPGMNRFSGFTLPSINDLGQVAFHGSVGGTSLTGVWMGSGPGDLSLLVRSGQQAPGHPAGTTIAPYSFGSAFQYDLQPLNNGKAVMVVPTGSTHRTPYVLAPGATPQPLAVPGQARPGNDGVWGASFRVSSTPDGRFVLNNVAAGTAGRIYIGTSANSLAKLAPAPGLSPQASAIANGITGDGRALIYARLNSVFGTWEGSWYSKGTNVTKIFVSGDPAPGLSPQTITGTWTPVANDAGRMAVVGTLSGGGNRMWTIPPAGGPPTLFDLTGRAASGLPGVTFASGGSVSPTRGDGFMVSATLQGPGVTAANDRAFYHMPSFGNPNSMRLRFREGDVAPNAGGTAKVFRDNFFEMGANSRGQAVFLDGTTMLAHDPTLGLVTLAAVGDKVETAPGVTRTISEFLDGIINIASAVGPYNSGRPRVLNEAGEVVLHLRFTDFTTGIFKTRVPVAGDATQDGLVNFDDFLALRDGFGKSFPGGNRSAGDFNLDGSVNFGDFQILERNFGYAPTGLSSGVRAADFADLASFAASVPEPGTALPLLAAAAMLGRKRRRRTVVNG
jgi:hypothetical protein